MSQNLAKAVFTALSVGDVRPIAIRVKPSDEATVESATYIIIRREDPPNAAPFDPGGACLVTNDNLGSRIATPTFITFPQPGNYIVRYRITWSDGQVDNTVSAIVPVNPLAS